MAIFLIWMAVLITALTLYLRKVYSVLSDRGVRHLRVVPLFGNMFKILFRRERFDEDLDKMYNTFSEERFFGRYEFTKPTLMIRDLDLVKKIMIKDFEHFTDHRSMTDESVEPLFARNVASLKGQEWKDMRSTLSPAFTSSKIKLMVPFMKEVGDQMIRALKGKISKTDYMDIDCKDLTTRYANDVIATCAFGLKVDSHSDENNEFYKMGKSLSTFSLKQILLFLAISVFPWIAKKLNLSVFKKSTKDFFTNLVLNTMREREERNIIRPDMIHLLMEARKGKLFHDEKQSNNDLKDTGFATVEESIICQTPVKRDWSDNDLVAQAVLFFMAGFETISTAMSFGLHELAVHPEIQDRLVQEIKEHHVKNGGLQTFNSIQNMTYMDMVTSDCGQPGLALDRLCVKDYNLGKPNARSTKDFVMRKGEILSIPVWNFHRDAQFFPNPTKFDPERFSEENKHNINSMAYMPFGHGPRNCIGSRFALCELKTLLYQILLHMEISPSEKTCLPAKLSKQSLTPSIEGGHWLRFKSRKD